MTVSLVMGSKEVPDEGTIEGERGEGEDLWA
jgi:hypothetical protein